jgi:hypothetical protein
MSAENNPSTFFPHLLSSSSCPLSNAARCTSSRTGLAVNVRPPSRCSVACRSPSWRPYLNGCRRIIYACRLWHGPKLNFEYRFGYVYAWRKNIYSRVQAVVLFPVRTHHHRTINRHTRFDHIQTLLDGHDMVYSRTFRIPYDRDTSAHDEVGRIAEWRRPGKLAWIAASRSLCPRNTHHQPSYLSSHSHQHPLPHLSPGFVPGLSATRRSILCHYQHRHRRRRWTKHLEHTLPDGLRLQR